MTASSKPVRLSLALQGGGAHGAYTWGVLDALLADRRWSFDAVSGTSAGALNAIVLADGLARGGGDPDAAREALAAFWAEVGTVLPFEWFAGADPDQPGLAPVARVALQWTQLLSPYQLNPLGLNPLRELLLRCVDFERLRAASPLRLHIAATAVRTGALRLFREHELTVDMAMASACLPTLHHAVEIGGEAYWDGGYSANPALSPLVEPADDARSQADDLLIVMLSPLAYAAPGARAPTSVAEIRARAAEIAFNATFRCEAAQLGAACDAARADGWLAAQVAGPRQRRLRRLRWHLIDAQDALGPLASETKLLAHRPFLEKLHGLGAHRARVWLEGDAARVGKSSTVHLPSWFA